MLQSSTLSHNQPLPLLLVFVAIVLLFTGCAVRKTASSAKTESEQQAIDILMVAYDNGDGRAFLNLIPELNARDIRWHILTFGPAAALFPTNDRITNLNIQATPEQQQELLNNRYAELPTSLTATLPQQFKPTIMLTGMAHKAQAELAKTFWWQGAWTIAFYDNMEPPQGQLWVTPWLEEPKPAIEQLVVPSVFLKNSFPENYTRSDTVTAVRHPSYKEWQEAFAREDVLALKHNLNLDSRPIVLIAGGYGDDYLYSLVLMQKAAALRPDLQWLLAPHPRELFQSTSASTLTEPNVKIITEVPTVRLAALAQLVLTHRSTVGWMAAQAGVPVIFVRPESEQETLSHGLIRTVNSESALLNAIHRQLDHPAPRPTTPPDDQEYDLIDILEQKLQGKEFQPVRVEAFKDSHS